MIGNTVLVKAYSVAFNYHIHVVIYFISIIRLIIHNCVHTENQNAATDTMFGRVHYYFIVNCIFVVLCSFADVQQNFFDSATDIKV